MSPLIDCVLQLLVFFMLSSTFATPKLDIVLPDAEGTGEMTDKKAITISADADGGLWVDQDPVTQGDLGPRLAVAPQRVHVLRTGAVVVPGHRG